MRLADCPYKFCRRCGEPRDHYGALSPSSGEKKEHCADCGSDLARNAWKEFAMYDMLANLFSVVDTEYSRVFRWATGRV